MKFIPTHTATVIGCDERTHIDWKQSIVLRATKTMLVSAKNRKWRIDGSGFGTWPLTRLIDITPIKSSKPEPLVLWGLYEENIHLHTYTTKQAAESYASKLNYPTTIKKFVEVTE